MPGYDVREFLVANTGSGLAVGAILCNRPVPVLYSHLRICIFSHSRFCSRIYGYGFGAITQNRPYQTETNANPGTETNPHSGAGHSTVLDWLIDFGVGWGYAFSFYTASLGVSLRH